MGLIGKSATYAKQTKNAAKFTGKTLYLRLVFNFLLTGEEATDAYTSNKKNPSLLRIMRHFEQQFNYLMHTVDTEGIDIYYFIIVF